MRIQLEDNVFNELPLPLAVPRVAQLLGFSRAATYRLVASGELGAPTRRSRVLRHRRTSRVGRFVKGTVYQCKTRGPAFVEHPQVGPLDLRYRVLALPETRHALVAYYAEPRSPSEERLQMLAGLAAASRFELPARSWAGW